MDRPNDFSVTAEDGVFRLQADLSDKRCDLGCIQWHGCELLATRPWAARDLEGDAAPASEHSSSSSGGPTDAFMNLSLSCSCT